MKRNTLDCHASLAKMPADRHCECALKIKQPKMTTLITSNEDVEHDMLNYTGLLRASQ